jgi:hypothetical protein
MDDFRHRFARHTARAVILRQKAGVGTHDIVDFAAFFVLPNRRT